MALFRSNLTWSLWWREILMAFDSHPVASNYCSAFFAVYWQQKLKRFKNLKGVKGNFFPRKKCRRRHPCKQRGWGFDSYWDLKFFLSNKFLKLAPFGGVVLLFCKKISIQPNLVTLKEGNFDGLRFTFGSVKLLLSIFCRMLTKKTQKV